jgi:sec-independent protein translocase protein TatA
MPDIGGWELVLVLAVLVLLFGAKKLPDAARSLGRSMRIFKSEVKGLRDDDEPKVPPALAEGDPAREAREFEEWKAQRSAGRSETR